MIALIIGTNRPGSNTAKVAAHVADLYTALDEPLQVVDLHRLPPDVFQPASYEKPPATFEPFQEPIRRAEGVIIVIPEYNGSMPGVFKYYLDLLEKPDDFRGMPVTFVGLAAGMWGAFRPVEQLEAVFGNLGALVYPDKVNLPKIDDHLDEAGRVKTPALLQRLESQARGFIDFVKKVRAR